MKKKWQLRGMAMVLTMAMIVGLLAGCGGENKEASKTGAPETATQGGGEETETGGDQSTEAPDVEISYPLENAGTLSWYCKNGIGVNNEYEDYTQSPFHTGLSRITGVNIEWMYAPVGSNEDTAYNLLLQEPELPSIIFGVNSDEISELYEDDLIYDLTEYLPKYAPDYWEFINRDETWYNEIADIDGRILRFCFIRDEANSTYQGPIIRQDWLDECDLEMPVTLEDWEEVLVAFKERYGAVLCAQKSDIFNNLNGIASGTDSMGGIGLDFYVDEDGKIQCAQVQEEWREMIEILNRWSDMELIDPDFTTANNKAVQAKALSGATGVIIANISKITNYVADAEAAGNGAEWVPLGYARTEAGAPAKNVHYSAPVNDKGAVITKSCSEEELMVALKLLNYGYTEEGIQYWNYGEQGVSYYVDENGLEQWTDQVLNDPSGYVNVINKYSGITGSGPAFQTAQHVSLRNDPICRDAMKLWQENSVFKDYRVPALDYTADENSKRADLVTTIETYAEPMELKLLTGEEPLENYSKFVEELYKLGLQEVLDIMQTAYDREYKD